VQAYTFTDKDFRKFNNRIVYWINKLGITGWRVETKHEQIGDGVNAQCIYNMTSRNVLFRLTKNTEGDYGFEVDLDNLALHEVLHLLVSDLVYAAGKDDEGLLVSVEHSLLHKLMAVLKEDTNV
jgi:hypothetical protein